MIRKVSKKRGKQLREYSKLKKEYLETHLHCEVNRYDCSDDALEIHHTNKRYGVRLLDTEYFMAVCRTCHMYVHEHPAESKEKGWLC